MATLAGRNLCKSALVAASVGTCTMNASSHALSAGSKIRPYLNVHQLRRSHRTSWSGSMNVAQFHISAVVRRGCTLTEVKARTNFPISAVVEGMDAVHTRKRDGKAEEKYERREGKYDTGVDAFVVSLTAKPLNVDLRAPFAIASASMESVQNAAVRLELSNGVVGWGEIPTLPPVTAEDQHMALSGCSLAAKWAVGRNASDWHSLLQGLSQHLPGHQHAAVRCGIEMALVDAVAKSVGVPAWKFFGGWSKALKTDITIPICSPEAAEQLAALYKSQGFSTIKTKVGGTKVADDIARLRAIRRSHPECELVIDANGGYTCEEAAEVLEILASERLLPSLYEQPVAREDWEGLAKISLLSSKKYGVPVAADESCRSPEDARRIAREGLAQVLNIKLAKVGVLGALEVAAIARDAGLGLMIGGMVETRLGMGFAAHLAAGLGGFGWIDLDTPLLLKDDPVCGGYQASGSLYTLGDGHGHGASLDWSRIGD